MQIKVIDNKWNLEVPEKVKELTERFYVEPVEDLLWVQGFEQTLAKQGIQTAVVRVDNKGYSLYLQKTFKNYKDRI